METNDERKWCVYIHRNMINNKAYIGITGKKPEKRWGNNGSQYHKSNEIAFKSAIQKYGWDKFEHIIWAEKLTEEEAKIWEIRLIALFKTNCSKYKNPSYGYNLTDGGEGTIGYKHTDEAKEKMSKARIGKKPWNYGISPTEETLRKLSESHKGYKPSREQLEKMSKSMTEWWSHEENKLKMSGENSSRYGAKLSEETKKKISDSNKGKKLSKEQIEKLRVSHLGFAVSEETKQKLRDNSLLKRKIVQLSIDGIFIALYDGLKIAEESTGVKYQNISACVRHIKKSAGGFIWIYEDEYDQSVLYSYESHREKAIVQLTKSNEYVAEYNSISEASRQTGFSASGIGECCKGIHKYSHGYIFMYKKDYEQLINIDNNIAV